ncbi:MAG: hypothetical protein LUF04_05160 [Bacteroides sp.]|nr:hypothetical protein [Bacteroides sp.]
MSNEILKNSDKDDQIEVIRTGTQQEDDTFEQIQGGAAPEQQCALFQCPHFECDSYSQCQEFTCVYYFNVDDNDDDDGGEDCNEHLPR